jgi:hypothetical protein
MPLLEGRDIYLAGIADHDRALKHTQRAVTDGIIKPEDKGSFFTRELQFLLARRIQRGELAPNTVAADEAVLAGKG